MVYEILKPAPIELLVHYIYADLTKQQLNRCTKDDRTPMIKDLLINIDPHAADKHDRGEYILFKTFYLICAFFSSVPTFRFHLILPFLSFSMFRRTQASLFSPLACTAFSSFFVP